VSASLFSLILNRTHKKQKRPTMSLPPRLLSSKTFLSIGLTIAGFDRWMMYTEAANNRRFVQHFGATPPTVADIWNAMIVHTDTNCRVEANTDPKYLLLGLRFLWTYHTQASIGSFFGIQSEKTVRKWIRMIVSKLAALLQYKVKSFAEADIGLRFFFTVDGTHCQITEPKPFSTSWSSHKFGGAPGLNYEIGLCIDRPLVIWINGPFPPGAVNDITVFKGSFMVQLQSYALTVGRRVRGLGDRGYRGVPEFISIRNDFDPPEIAQFKSRAMARHESYNSKLKQWTVLRALFLHNDIAFHSKCFRAVNTITIFQLENGSQSLFDAYP
jgi:hypothetical protein